MVSQDRDCDGEPMYTLATDLTALKWIESLEFQLSDPARLDSETRNMLIYSLGVRSPESDA